MPGRQAPATPFPDVAPSSERRLALVVLAPALLAIACVAVLGVTSLSLLSALRAYAAGESLWAQGTGQAVDALRDYARTRDPNDYLRFEQALRVPLADRQAREELERPRPDLERARQGLIAGDNHPADVDSMLLLYNRFGWLPPFQSSLRSWQQGDDLVAQLRDVASGLLERFSGPSATAQGTPDAALEQLSRISVELSRAERRFTDELSSAARVMERVLIAGVLAIAGLLTLGGFWAVRRSLQRRAEREQALAEANARWALAAEAGGLGLYDWVVPTDELRMDAKAAKLYGLADGTGLTVRRATLSALLLPEDLDGTRRALDDALATGGRFRARYRVRRPDGTIRHLEATGAMQADARLGARMVGVVRDVTEELRQAELAQERDVAERASRARMEFLSRLSHELRTPLNAILGFAQLLSMDGDRPLDGPQAHRVKLILDGGQQLLKLVEDVLDLTRIDAGTLSVETRPVDVAEVLRTSLELAASVAKSFGVELVDEAPAAPLWALADDRRLQQVLINLLTNACKYNRPGGRATVRAWQAGQSVTLSVEDDGIGITEAEQERLFLPFSRLPGSAARVEGTGLGLFIVRTLVERMDGRVEVSSRWGEGTRFEVSLPAAAAAG